MSPDPVKLIGLDKLLQPGPEKLAVPPELSEWAQAQAGRELARRTAIISVCVEEALIGVDSKKLDRMVFKDRCRGAWTRLYSRYGGDAGFDNFWRSVQQAGSLEKWGWKPVKERDE